MPAEKITIPVLDIAITRTRIQAADRAFRRRLVVWGCGHGTIEPILVTSDKRGGYAWPVLSLDDPMFSDPTELVVAYVQKVAMPGATVEQLEKPPGTEGTATIWRRDAVFFLCPWCRRTRLASMCNRQTMER